jgi:ABC-type cobalamin transport system ATPase subunit
MSRYRDAPARLRPRPSSIPLSGLGPTGRWPNWSIHRCVVAPRVAISNAAAVASTLPRCVTDLTPRKQDRLRLAVQLLSPLRGTGPTGKMRRLFEAASQLPRSQQEKLTAVLEAFVNQHATR